MYNQIKRTALFGNKDYQYIHTCMQMYGKSDISCDLWQLYKYKEKLLQNNCPSWTSKLHQNNILHNKLPHDTNNFMTPTYFHLKTQKLGPATKLSTSSNHHCIQWHWWKHWKTPSLTSSFTLRLAEAPNYINNIIIGISIPSPPSHHQQQAPSIQTHAHKFTHTHCTHKAMYNTLIPLANFIQSIQCIQRPVEWALL